MSQNLNLETGIEHNGIAMLLGLDGREEGR
jgi:hypothetical protein